MTGGNSMRVMLLALAILAAAMADTSAQTSAVAAPKALSAALAEYGCVHIADDAEVLRNRRRWWVSLEPFTGGDADFAFYCQSVADKLVARLIIAVKSDKNPWGGCDTVVDSWHERVRPWFPYDLVVVNARGAYRGPADLSRWWLVSSSRNVKVTYGPAGVKAPHPIIDTIGDGGAGTLYACYSRQWYRIGLD
jgi:hypothetical protein